MTDINLQTQIELLKVLLDENYKERNVIGAELHNNKFYLNSLSLAVKTFETQAEKGKVDFAIIEEQKHLISEFKDVLGITRSMLYPPILTLSGLIIAIRQYIINYQKNYPVNVEVNFDQDEIYKYQQINDIRIYKSCIEIIDCLFQCKAKSLKINLKFDGKVFEFEVLAKLKMLKRIHFDLGKKTDLIKAYIFWAGGDIQDKTNWKDNYSLKFEVNK